jgi:hypothetical protein
MRWLYHLVRPYLRWPIASFICIAAGSFLALLAPLVLKWLIDVILPGRRMWLLIAQDLLPAPRALLEWQPVLETGV